jgi:CRP-like cAMP-binding protein
MSAAGTPVAPLREGPVADVALGLSPGLDVDQLARLRRSGKEVDVHAGDVLSAAGDDTYDLVVVLDGEVDVIEARGKPAERVLATFGPGGFLGELGLLAGGRVSFTSVRRTSGRVLRVTVPAVRTVMAQEPELSEVLLRACLLRRAYLMRVEAGPTPVGSAFDPNTRRLLQTRVARTRPPTRAARPAPRRRSAAGCRWGCPAPGARPPRAARRVGVRDRRYRFWLTHPPQRSCGATGSAALSTSTRRRHEGAPVSPLGLTGITHPTDGARPVVARSSRRRSLAVSRLRRADSRR